MNAEKELKFIEQMHPFLKERYLLFKEEMFKATLAYILTSVARTVLEQMSLFVQGRLDLKDVNRFRWIAGLTAIANETNNNVVTWTLDSKHVTNMFDNSLNNDYARAFDIAIINSAGTPIWNIKIDVNQSGSPDYNEAGVIGESVGLVWGGRFKNPDKPHYQIEEV